METAFVFHQVMLGTKNTTLNTQQSGLTGTAGSSNRTTLYLKEITMHQGHP